MNLAEAALTSGWHARLALGYEAGERGTRLMRRAHDGPLLVQKPLYPEGPQVCHSILLHPPGGLVGGDHLEFEAELGAGSHALITTPGAGKWYRSAGPSARQQLRFRVAAGARLEWLPQDSIVFDGAVAHMSMQVELEPGAAFMGWEVVCLGRSASGERFRSGSLRQRIEIRQGGELLFAEYGALQGGDPLLDSPVGLAGRSVYGTLLLAGNALPQEVLAACRDVAVDEAHGERCGVTALPQVLAARYVGHGAERARQYFVRLWQVLRPWYAGRLAEPPRIWQT